MGASRVPARWFWVLLSVLALVVAILKAPVAYGQPPQPNPVPITSTFGADVKGLNLNANGPAASIHGDPVAGTKTFAQSCAACHGPRGIGGLPNPGSDDGTVPSLNPADPGFMGETPGDAATFAKNIDLFIQHGSRPSGPNPVISMAGWGDRKLLTQQQIADAEAYIMQLNGVYWPDRWGPPADVQMNASRNGNTVTYAITVGADGASDLTDLTLRDTLPPGLTYVDSYLQGPGQNRGKWTGSTVEWDTMVPRGGEIGPFYIVTTAQGSTVPPNVAQVEFSWTGLDGTLVSGSTAVSEPIVPAAPATATPVATQPVAPPAATLVPATQQPPATAVATATPVTQATESVPTMAPATGAPAATSVPATVAPAATEVPTAAPAVNAAEGAQLFQTKNCVACHRINGNGGAIGPDLSHIGSQPYDAMPNDPAFLNRWLHDPQSIKPGTLMPKVDMTDAEINTLVAYLVSLK